MGSEMCIRDRINIYGRVRILPICHELNVLGHELAVHSDEGAGQGLGQELGLDGDSLRDDLSDALLAGLVLRRKEKEE